MNIASTTQSPSTISTQHQSPQTPLLKTANDLPKLALQLIPEAPKATGNVGSVINVFV